MTNILTESHIETTVKMAVEEAQLIAKNTKELSKVEEMNFVEAKAVMNGFDKVVCAINFTNEDGYEYGGTLSPVTYFLRHADSKETCDKLMIALNKALTDAFMFYNMPPTLQATVTPYRNVIKKVNEMLASGLKSTLKEHKSDLKPEDFYCTPCYSHDASDNRLFVKFSKGSAKIEMSVDIPHHLSPTAKKNIRYHTLCCAVEESIKYYL